MSLLLFAIVVIVIVAMLVYAVDLLPMLGQFAGFIKVLVILVGVLMIVNRAGLL